MREGRRLAHSTIATLLEASRRPLAFSLVGVAARSDAQVLVPLLVGTVATQEPVYEVALVAHTTIVTDGGRVKALGA